MTNIMPRPAETAPEVMQLSNADQMFGGMCSDD